MLLARRGVYSEREAWQRLTQSFRRAADVVDPPALRDIGRRPFWEVRMLIYWSGAAMALLADTRLRQASGGRDSLDSALGRLRQCCLPSTRAWRGEQLFAKLDELGSVAIFADLFDAHLAQRGMPDMTALYAKLGIVMQPGSDAVALNDEAPLASVRRAIMGRH